MLAFTWSKVNTQPLLIGVETYKATMEISVVFLQEDINISTSRSSYTTPGHIPTTQTCFSTMFTDAVLLIAWIKKILYIYGLEYYSGRKNGIMKFDGKWKKLKKSF